jgi:electron transfer flavoprotein beta subunit
MDPDTHTIVRNATQSVINPFDSFAVELAVQLKEMLGAETWVLSMGIPAAERLLRDSCARGIDKAMLLTDPAFAGADTLATAYTLALGIRKIGDVNLIICGKMAVDGDTAQIGPELAENLGIPHVTDVRSIIEVSETTVKLVRQIDEGTQELFIQLPVLLTVVKDINEPRMPSIPGIRRSMGIQLVTMNAFALGADLARIGLTGSPTQVVCTQIPEGQGNAVLIEGNAAKQAEAILGIVAELR